MTPDTHDCPYCDRAFARADYRDLHLGQDHADALTDGERERHETARENEREQLRLLQLKAVAALVVLYFGLLVVAAVSI